MGNKTANIITIETTIPVTPLPTSLLKSLYMASPPGFFLVYIITGIYFKSFTYHL